MGRYHFSDVLELIGTGNGWWHDFFETLSDDEFLLYDLGTSPECKRCRLGS